MARLLALLCGCSGVLDCCQGDVISRVFAMVVRVLLCGCSGVLDCCQGELYLGLFLNMRSSVILHP